MQTLTPPAPPDRTTTHAHLLLTRLTVAFSRRRAYPSSHPLVLTSETQAFAALQTLLMHQPRVTLVVSRTGLVVDDAPVDRAFGVARDLADRLRRRGIGGLAFDTLVSPDSLQTAIAWIGADDGPGGAHDDRCKPPVLGGVRITLIDYGKLSLGDEAGSDTISIEDIWQELASGTLDEGEFDRTESDVSGSSSDTRDHVQDVERRLARPEAAHRAGAVLLRVADQIAHAGAASRDVLAERLRTVLKTMQPSSIQSVIASCGAGEEKRRFVAQMIEALPAPAIVSWLDAAARASGEPLSPQLLHVLSSLLARTRQQGSGRDGEAAFRAAARELVNGWALDDPSPSDHAALLDRISAFDAMRTLADAPDTGAVRLVQLALEADAVGDDVVDAANQLLAQGRVADLLDWCAAAPGRAAAETIQALASAPAVVNAVLLRDPLDQVLARALLTSVGDSARDALLDVLRDAESRTARRLVLARLREYGESLAPVIIARLEGAPWYFARNLLSLLREVSEGHQHTRSARAEQLVKQASHEHEQVRVEALRVLVRNDTLRGPALRRALDDPAERVVSAALDALSVEATDASAPRPPSSLLPPELVQRLLRLAESDSHADDVRAKAIRLLALAPTNTRVLDALLRVTTVRTRVLRRLALADASSAVLAALEVLARQYRGHAPATPIIELAARSTERGVRNAVLTAGAEST